MSLDRRTFLESLALSWLAPSLRRGRARATAEPSRSDRPFVVVRPEYERTLESVLICIPADTVSFGAPPAHDDLGRAALGRFLDAVFRDLLAALPSYSVVHVVAPVDRRDLGLATLKRAGERRSQLHVVDDPGVEIELWAQDLGEPVLDAGEEKFLVAKRMGASMGAQSKMSIDRKRVAEYVFGEEATIEAGFAFESGNLAFDRARGSLRVLVGTNVLSRTVATHRAVGENVSRAAVLAEIAATFGRAEVVEMGRESQRPLLQHIDQAFVLLEGGLAVAARLRSAELEDEARQLETYAGQLRELGYRVHYLDHGPEDVARYRSSVNIVPFVDKSTGDKRLLYPVFPGEVETKAKDLTRETLRGKGLRAFDLYRDLGYEPVPVRDVSHSLGGNTHCILNALS
jgi:hypothetical protein